MRGSRCCALFAAARLGLKIPTSYKGMIQRGSARGSQCLALFAAATESGPQERHLLVPARKHTVAVDNASTLNARVHRSGYKSAQTGPKTGETPEEM